jgi:predicted AlkP superfamily pyrophosphatase or phosphodiesterase
MRKFLAATLTVAFFAARPATAQSAYEGKPKLVVILVLDQFRGDYLDRFRADFKTPHGFNLFLKTGAYFPECYYDYANTMTAPGHSTIGTGAYTNGHNIAVNDWWDLSRSTEHTFSSVDDPEYPLVGASSHPETGASPRNELASTLGDEVVLGTGGKAKLFGVSLKDRAAILTSGHASRAAYWLDHATGHFESSKYWMNELPGWVESFNTKGRGEQARKEAGAETGDFYDKVGATPAAVSYELDFAKALVENEGLGKDDVTDVLTVSISSTDILGHQVGPDDPRQREMIDRTDMYLNDFFDFLDKHVDGGLANVWVSLTGDHGVAPSRGAQGAGPGVERAVFADRAGEVHSGWGAAVYSAGSEDVCEVWRERGGRGEDGGGDAAGGARRDATGGAEGRPEQPFAEAGDDSAGVHEGPDGCGPGAEYRRGPADSAQLLDEYGLVCDGVAGDVPDVGV